MKKKVFKNNMNYVEAIQNGLIDYKDIIYYIEKWHQSNSIKTVYEYLGMTEEQYKIYVEEHIKGLKKLFIKNK